jgi:hypothetical protein
VLIKRVKEAAEAVSADLGYKPAGAPAPGGRAPARTDGM